MPTAALNPRSFPLDANLGACATQSTSGKSVIPLSADTSPNLSRYAHKHARDTPDAVVYLIPEESPRPAHLQTPGKGWLPCTWAQYSDFIAELVFKFERDENVGNVLDKPGQHLAALLISPAEDMLPITLALVSLGYAILPINPHLSPVSIAHLLKLANASLLVCSQVPEFTVNPPVFQMRTLMLTHEHRLGSRIRSGGQTAPPPQLAAQYEAIKARADTQVVQDPAYYLHSSGSTGFPKLVPWRNTATFASIKEVTRLMKLEEPHEAQRDNILFITKDLFAVIPVGLCQRIIYAGKGWTVAFPRESVLEQSTEGLLEDMTAVKATNISVYTCDASAFVRYVTAPSIDEEHAKKQQRYLNYLRQLGPIPCGGSRIDRSLVREAIPLGIQIKSTFGTTECSAAMTSFPDNLGPYWGKITADQVTEDMIDRVLAMIPLPFIGTQFAPLLWNTRECETEGRIAGQEDISELYELMLDTHSPYYSSPEASDRWWHSRDLFRVIQHPVWKTPMYVYETRMDDMVILSNGASLHPARIEENVIANVGSACHLSERIAKHDTAEDATGLASPVDIMLVGTGRAYPSLLIEGLSDPEDRRTFLQAFDQSYQKINASFAAYSHLQPKLFYFLSAGEQLPRTVKNTINRKKAEQMYSSQLDELYKAV